jgi:hypothetical protein
MVAIAKTFGGACTEQTMGTGVLNGSRVRLTDPMLKQSVYYNVVDAPLIRRRVEELLDGGTRRDQAPEVRVQLRGPFS